MKPRPAFSYHTEENIHLNAVMIIKSVNVLEPDYLKIEELAQNIIKYCKQGIKYNDTKRI